MRAEIKQYTEIKNQRATLTRKNAGLRMAGKSNQQKELPVLPLKPVKYLLEDKEGNYMGIEYDCDTAYEYAENNKLTVTALPYDK